MPAVPPTAAPRPFVEHRREKRSRRAPIRSAAIVIIAAIVGLAAPAVCRAQLFSGISSRREEPSTPPHPSVARVVVPEKDGISFGSGTLVDVRDNVGLLITNWHVVADGAGTITVIFPDGFQSPARVLKTDKDWDLAALAIWKPTVQPVAISAVAPRPGEPLAIGGYGSGNWRLAVGRCTQYLAPADNLPYEMIEVSAEARQGDSGGPILNQRGELAGVLFGAARGTTSGSYAGRVRQFLTPILTPSEAAPDAIAANEKNPPSGTPLQNMSPVSLPPQGDVSAAPTTIERARQPPPVQDTAVIPSPLDDIGPVGTTPPPAATQIAPHLSAPDLVPIERRDSADQGLVYSPLPPRGGRGGSSTSLGGGSASDADPLRRIWQQIAGTTPFDQGKTIFAALGAMTLLYRFMGKESAKEAEGEDD